MLPRVVYEPKCNPFRVFSRDVVVNQMQVRRISAQRLVLRSMFPIKFETFVTLSDPVEYFAEAMTTELEHGRVGNFIGTDVTNDDIDLTARIAAVHLSGLEYGAKSPADRVPFTQYYDYLWWMELQHKEVQSKQSIIIDAFI